MATGARPTDAPGWGLLSHWHDLIGRGDPRFGMLARVEEVGTVLDRMEASIQRRMWNLQRHWTIAALRDAVDADARFRGRGVDVRLVLPRRVAERRCPLASSYDPTIRLAPVAHALMVWDDRQVIVGDATGETVWTSTDPGVVDSAVRFYEGVWSAAEPAVPEGSEPPFTRRMVDIAIKLVDGATDREIARSLGVSERTVSAELRELSRRLGAQSRAHVVALVAGGDG